MDKVLWQDFAISNQILTYHLPKLKLLLLLPTARRSVSATGIEKVRRPDNDKCIMGSVEILWSGSRTRA